MFEVNVLSFSLGGFHIHLGRNGAREEEGRKPRTPAGFIHFKTPDSELDPKKFQLIQLPIGNECGFGCEWDVYYIHPEAERDSSGRLRRFAPELAEMLMRAGH